MTGAGALSAAYFARIVDSFVIHLGLLLSFRGGFVAFSGYDRRRVTSQERRQIDHWLFWAYGRVVKGGGL